MRFEFLPSRSENIPDLEFHVILAELSRGLIQKSKFQYVSIEEY